MTKRARLKEEESPRPRTPRSVQEKDPLGAGVSRVGSPQSKAGAALLHNPMRPGRSPWPPSASPTPRAQGARPAPVRFTNPKGSRSKAGSVWLEPQGTGPGSTKRAEYIQRPIIDVPNTEFNSKVHAPTRPLFNTEAEPLSLALHQLQVEVRWFTDLHNNM